MIMASTNLLIELSPDGQAEARNKVNAELSVLWQQFHIPADAQARLSVMGYRNVVTWAHLGETPSEVRKFVKAELGLQANGHENYCALVSSPVGCWEGAQTRGEKRKADDATQRAVGEHRRRTKSQHLLLLRAYNDSRAEAKRLRPSQSPAPPYVEALANQIEDGELDAERLSDVALDDDVK